MQQEGCTVYLCQSDPSCLQVKSPGFEEAVIAFCQGKNSGLPKNLMMSSHLLFIHDISNYSGNTKKPYVMEASIGITEF